MKIGIDASRAFLRERTGIEEYSYQTIKHLRGPLKDHQVVLYLRKNQSARIDFELPERWSTKTISLPRFWTQLGLAFEMFRKPVDVLFIPAHIVPWIHPSATVVTIHGLEYEFMPEAYSLWERFYMRLSIRMSCRWARKIIAVSKNTKKDLEKFYGVPEEKVRVIYEGTNFGEYEEKNLMQKEKDPSGPYLLFIGRLEKRKNIEGIIAAFEILKEKYKIPHKLVLAGKPGYGFPGIEVRLENSSRKKEIILTGFVEEARKWELLRGADVFLFPTFYEGFGLPILEAQVSGVPVVASHLSSLPEVAGESALYADPGEPAILAETVNKLIEDKELRNVIIKKGHENLERFHWETCAKEIAGLITGFDK